MWPIEERTKKSGPKNLFIVFAFAGDSTITKDFGIEISLSNFLVKYFVENLSRAAVIPV